MSHRCISSEQIEDIVCLPADDERRKDAERCPRCRSLIRQFIEFSAGTVDDADEAAAVRSHLRQFLDEKVRHGGDAAVGKEGNMWSRLTAVIRPRPMLAAAAVATAAIMIVTLVPWQSTDKGEIVLRGDEDAVAGFELPPADISVPGSVSLRWPRVSGAESYRVAVYDASFNELVAVEVTDTALTVPASELFGGWQTTSTLQWEVEALRHGDVLNRSETGLLKKP